MTVLVCKIYLSISHREQILHRTEVISYIPVRNLILCEHQLLGRRESLHMKPVNIGLDIVWIKLGSDSAGVVQVLK